MNGNDKQKQIADIIRQAATKYGLNQTEVNTIYQNYKDSPKKIEDLSKEIVSISSFYFYQHKLENVKQTTPNLEQGKNYYLTTYDSNGNIYLQPVSVAVINAEKSEVIIENTFKGYQKHTSVDDLEIAICQIGKLLNFNVVEEYRLYNANKEKDSIIIKDLINDNEFYDVENLKKRFSRLITSGKLNKEKWVDEYQQLTVANTKEDYKSIIEYGLNILKSLPSILEEDYNQIEEKYFEMLLFDCLINQSERNFKDYGIICDKETKRYTFAPLFDNVFPSILKNNDVMSVNGITCNRYDLIECLFYNYYDKIKNKVEQLLKNKDTYLKNIDMILKYNLDINSYNMLYNNIITNLNYFERLNNEKTLMANNQNAGYVNIVQLIIGLAIVIGFSVCIAYLLYCIK